MAAATHHFQRQPAIAFVLLWMHTQPCVVFSAAAGSPELPELRLPESQWLAVLRCDNPMAVQSGIGPDWLAKAGVKSPPAEFDFPD